MDLNTLCFLLFGLLFIGFLVLEGLNYGVGMLIPFLAKTDIERQAFVQTIAPIWESNQVWMIVAGAILFAGFPEGYATLFSGFYLALFCILAALLLRGIGIVFHNKDENLLWRHFCYWSIFAGSLVPSLVWGIAVACLLQGVPISEDKHYSGDFFDLLSLYSLISGLTFILLYLFHGATYLAFKIDPSLTKRSQRAAFLLSKYTLLAAVVLSALTLSTSNANNRPWVFFFAFTTIVCLSFSRRSQVLNRFVPSLVASSLAIAALATSIFAGLYPRVMVSSLKSEWSLDIYNASSNPWTLTIMIRTLLIVLPLVISFEGWKFYIFRHRINLQDIELAAHCPHLRQMNEKLKKSILYGNCLVDVLEKVETALRINDGTIIRNLKPEHRSLLLGTYKLRKLSVFFSKHRIRD